jgi:hypothetical protein
MQNTFLGRKLVRISTTGLPALNRVRTFMAYEVFGSILDEIPELKKVLVLEELETI